MIKIKTLSVVESSPTVTGHMHLLPSQCHVRAPKCSSGFFTIPSVWPHILIVKITLDLKIHKDALKVCNLREEMRWYC